MKKKDIATIIIAVIALSLSIFNTSWQYQTYLERSFKPEFLVSNVDPLVLHGDSFDWQTSFAVALKIATPKPLKIWIALSEDHFFVNNEASSMLVQEYPLSINITNKVELLSDSGVKDILLTVPVRAKFLIKGQYQALYSNLTIGKLNFLIHIKDLNTANVTTLECNSDVIWMEK